MKDFSRYFRFVNTFVGILLLGLFLFGNLTIFILAYVCLAIVFIIRAVKYNTKKRAIFSLILCYLSIMSVQIVYVILVVFNSSNNFHRITYLASKLFGTILVLLPYMIEPFLQVNRYVDFYLPSAHEIGVISFNQFLRYKNSIVDTLHTFSDVKKAMTITNLKFLFEEFRRHSSTKYINDGTIDKGYFENTKQYFDDPYLYIVISNTGSQASELIKIVTKKQFNHASISFDRDLKTIVSYNGGAKIYPPGLNPETIEFFYQKEDSSVMVYRLKATREQQEIILNKIKEINENGSAYNFIGLLLKRSHKPNIMFCSQFVYTMLTIAGLAYFEQKSAYVRPFDLVELDYKRKLEFCYEVKVKKDYKNESGTT